MNEINLSNRQNANFGGHTDILDHKQLGCIRTSIVSFIRFAARFCILELKACKIKEGAKKLAVLDART